MAQRQFRRPDRELIYYVHRSDPEARLVVFDGTHYRYHDDPTGTPLADLPVQEYRCVAHMRYYRCGEREYPWDQWKQWAVEDGVPEPLAELGRQVIRMAHEHNWPADLQHECGWDDHGAAMIQSALSHPDETRSHWQRLLDTNGGRVELHSPSDCDAFWKSG